jgi:hypothetical protein
LGLEKESNNSNLEYVIVDANENELWEIDYDKNIALDVSEVIKPHLIDKLITYSGKIEDFLQKERGCKNIHFHNSFSVPTRIHLKEQNSKLKGCNFN